MKIAYLLGSLNRGGTETLLLDVFRNAHKCGLDAMGIYRKTGVLELDFLTSGVKMEYVPSSKNLINYILKLRKVLLVNKIEVVHAQQPIDALFAYLACKGLKIKLVLTFHGYDFTEKALGKIVLEFIIKKTDCNVYVSDSQRVYYQNKYKLNPKNQKVVYNGISFDKLGFGHPINASLRNELKLSSDTLLMGAVGNFNDVRDQFTICKFLKLLKDKEVDFHFVFVGKRLENNANLYDNCVEYCTQNDLSEQISFLGVRNDVPQILKELEAFIYSTDHDTFGLAVVEAMAVGIPVFVNDWGVMCEITEQGKYATLYKTKDEIELLRKFMLFLQNKAVFQANAKETSYFVRSIYSIDRHIEKLKHNYTTLTNKIKPQY